MELEHRSLVTPKNLLFSGVKTVVLPTPEQSGHQLVEQLVLLPLAIKEQAKVVLWCPTHVIVLI